MTKKIIIISSIACIVIISIAVYAYIDTSRPDPELNEKLYIENYKSTKYLDYYRDLFIQVGYSTHLKMGLDWYVIQYHEVYTNKSNVFYSGAFDSRDNSTRKLLNLYNSDNETYYYLKPYLDCYLLMDKDRKPSDEKLETIKETILYALDYYINGEDFVGTLEK